MYRVKKSCKMQFEQEKSKETPKCRTERANMWAERANTCCLRDFPTALEYPVKNKEQDGCRVPIIQSFRSAELRCGSQEFRARSSRVPRF